MNIQKKLKLIRQEIKNIDKKLINLYIANINLYEDSFKNNQARIEDLEAKQMLLKDEREELISKTIQIKLYIYNKLTNLNKEEGKTYLLTN